MRAKSLLFVQDQPETGPVDAKIRVDTHGRYLQAAHSRNLDRTRLLINPPISTATCMQLLKPYATVHDRYMAFIYKAVTGPSHGRYQPNPLGPTGPGGPMRSHAVPHGPTRSHAVPHGPTTAAVPARYPCDDQTPRHLLLLVGRVRWRGRGDLALLAPGSVLGGVPQNA